VNLAGIDHTALKRGMVLATPGKFRKTRRMDVRLELLPSARKLKQRSRVHFHAGTAETIAEVSIHGQRELEPGGSAFANLKLQDEVLVLPGDRFIVRQFSPVVTMGGGAVLDPLARRPMLRDAGRTAFLETLEKGKHEEILAAMTARAVLGLGQEDLVARTAWTEKDIASALEKVSRTGLARRSRNSKKRIPLCRELHGRSSAQVSASVFAPKHFAPRLKIWPRGKNSTCKASW
jgi:selenocysteine-specific elongation factor